MKPRRITSDQVRLSLKRFDNNLRYYGADSAVKLAFEQWPENTNFDQVLLKVVVLNRLYSTNILSIYDAAQHIIDHKIDRRLQQGDLKLVNDVADMRLGSRKRYVLSFASKYCAWHQPNHFQIFDSFVEEKLWSYLKSYKFSSVKRYELRDYPKFIEAMKAFQAFFGLEGFSRKDIDKFLWIEGRRQRD